MTNELQRAMARYEAARGRYRLAVLESLGGRGRGGVIRAAIDECQAALAAVSRLEAANTAMGSGTARRLV